LMCNIFIWYNFYVLLDVFTCALLLLLFLSSFYSSPPKKRKFFIWCAHVYNFFSYFKMFASQVHLLTPVKETVIQRIQWIQMTFWLSAENIYEYFSLVRVKDYLWYEWALNDGSLLWGNDVFMHLHTI
jgi:hypothetical protein